MLALALAGLTAPAWGQLPGEWTDTWFRVTWGPREHGGVPMIEGHVYNAAPFRVSAVQLRVEGLDAEQQPVGLRFAWALGDIGPGGDTSFVVEAMPAAVHYRITVSSFDVVSVNSAP